MEMVAASKMRRAQMQVLSMRPYADKARSVLGRLATQRGVDEEIHPLFTSRPVKRVGLVLITSNKGLCGAYNHNVIRLADEYLENAQAPVDLITVGRVGRNAMLRAGHSVIADFEELPDQPDLLDIAPVARVVVEEFLTGVVDEVHLVYSQFVNTMVQTPRVEAFLPLKEIDIAAEEPATGEAPVEYAYEPSVQEILNALVPRFTEVLIYKAILEARASEHSARMVAMRAATENANELIEDLTLTYNKARQNAITREMLDIAGGVEALRAGRSALSA